MTLKNQAVIAGVGSSGIGKLPEKSGLDLCVDAALAAIDDAGLSVRDIDGMVTAYCSTEPYFVFYGALAEVLGLSLDLGVTMTAGGGTGGMMLHQALMAVATGQARHVLLVAGENRATGLGTEKATQMLSAFGHPWFEDVHGVPVPGFYGMVARRYFHEFGVGREQLAPVAVQTRANAALTPGAHKQAPLTVEEVLSSRPIVEPLHMLDCCLISDGAAALVVSRAEAAGDLPHGPAWIAGIGERFTHEHLIAAPDLLHSGATEAGRKAYRMAGLEPADIQFAELYDCFTITPILLAEELGFAGRGEGWTLWQDGAAGYAGRFPVNTHGGMLSHCHAGAAGGLFSIIECARQVRGAEGGRQLARHDVGLAHVEGGIMSNHTTVILTADMA